MTPLSLPAAVAAYFMADQQDDAEAVACCFSAHGVVVDDAQEYAGPAAIARWKRDASARFRYRCEPLRLEITNHRHIVTGRLTGNFPGSPLDLRYAFALDGDLITRLEIAA